MPYCPVPRADGIQEGMSQPPAIPRTDAALIALRRILRATEHDERDLAQAAKLTPAKLRVLQILAGTETRSAMPTQLSTQMGVSQATVTALVRRVYRPSASSSPGA